MGYAPRPTVKAPRPQQREPMDSKRFNELAKAGVLTVYEIRRQHGLASISGGDKLYIQRENLR
ncbi:hypothetical protein BJH90_03760 [Bacillus halotolerans]|uniref:hypothetical protein n=1 Tax=Bacillus halotolerans TaxID=260554 RepID=UPI000CD97BF5|nr:hypothetical protein [Bacillus halotolerans]PON02851.1 hypothetical protein BJH90_03760 [Bacillus halotolerans]